MIRRTVTAALGMALAAALALHGGARSGETKLYAIGTATAAGTVYQMGATLATVLNRHMPDAQFSTQATAGANQNIELMRTGDMDFAINVDLSSIDAWNGEKAFEGREPATYQRALFYVGTWTCHVVASLDSGINTFQDLRGKRVAVGAAGSGVENNTSLVCRALGMDYVNADVKPFQVEYMGIANSSEALANGQIDACFDNQLAPSPAHTNLMTSGKAKLIAYTQEEIDTVLSKEQFVQMTFPANTYPNQPAEVKSLGFTEYLAVRADFDEETAYQIAKTLMENLDEIREIYPGFMTTKDTPMFGVPVPVHPGAARYYREIGLEIPDTFCK